ncbi:unnamed protein product [Zymoseptoria tritici ST99CH_3D1]|uniref:Uncharacterized protein n=1 Tax=Zymoseptoria tritici (strain ST99CH_3D7) TaxID=1276538 RepID=A0A1X7RVZ4_ZYMT9|nr:unnamed protein product [Zymoseptoria tritici ST99CH_3D7]SMR54939.1 unnamed protein product [Zymoseptoria tritici ST99CH_3D1]
MASESAQLSELVLRIGDNYYSWRHKIFKVVMSKFRSIHPNQSFQHLFTELRRSEEGFRQRSTKAAIIIHNHVSIEILERVPNDDRMDAPRLLACLESRCKTYEFMKHTTEIRSLIYSFLPAFPAEKTIIRAANMLYLGPEKHDRLKGRRNVMPAVAQVCTIMRIETSRAIFRNRVFSFQFGRAAPAHLIHSTFKTWISQVAQHRYHHIQGYCLHFGFNRHPINFTLTADADNKIHLENMKPNRHHPGRNVFSARLNKQVLQANKKSAATGGEALRQMILDNAEMWTTY